MSHRSLKKLGKRIYDALFSDEGMALADKFEIEGFHVGGCYGFAYALQKWFGCGEIWVMTRGGEYPPQAQHVVLKIGDLFFDGAPKNAAKTQQELFDYWEQEIPRPRLIAMEGPVMEADRGRAAASVQFDEGTKCSANAVDEIVAFLQEKIGDPGNVCTESNPMEYPTTEEKFEMANPSAPAVSGYEGMRVEYTPAKKLPFSEPFRQAEDIVEFTRANRLTGDTRERFYAIYMDQQNKPLGYRLIGAGGPASAPVDPAVVFGPAMALQATSVVFVHNHPSGTEQFSPADVSLTERLLWAARMMGLRVLDHLLVVPNSHVLAMRIEHPKLMWEYDPAARALAPEVEPEAVAANPATEAYEIEPELAENPLWVDRILAANWEAVQARLQQMGHPDWLPVWSEGKKNKVIVMPEYGCGHYGCVYPTDADDVVVKLTTDATEATFVAILEQLKREGHTLPDGLVRYHGIYALEGEHKKRKPFILWREEAAVTDWGPVQNAIFEARGRESVKGVVHKAEILISMFKTISHHAFQIAHAMAKKKPEAEYFTWLEEQKAIGDEPPDHYYERWNDLVDRYGMVVDPYGYSGKFREWEKRVVMSQQLKTRFAWLCFVCRQIAQEMASSDVCYKVGEALNEFMDLDLLPADVHLNNVGLVNRPGDNDWAPTALVIIDPGHVVPLSSRFAQVEVEAI